MRVQQPERAIEVYESVLRWNPGDLRLASKMGEALVTTHEFEKAVVYYESAVRGAPRGTSPLQTDLAVLLMKLKQFEKAEKMLSSGVERLKSCRLSMQFCAGLYILMLLSVFHGALVLEK